MRHILNKSHLMLKHGITQGDGGFIFAREKSGTVTYIKRYILVELADF